MNEMNISEKLHIQFHKTSKLLKRNIFEQRMEHIKAVPYKGQGRILRLLLDNGEMSQKDIVIEMDIRPSTVWELVGKLEKVGFVEKIVNPDDKRGTIIRLTESGKQEARSSRWNLNNVSGELFSALDSEEQHQLSGLLDKLIVSLKKTEKEIEDDEFDFESFDEPECGCKMKNEFGINLRQDMKESKRFFKDLFKDLGIKKKEKDTKTNSSNEEDKENTTIEVTVNLDEE